MIQQNIPIQQIRYTPRELSKEEQDLIPWIAETVIQTGLWHPITVQEFNGGFKLIAGLKRLLAFESLQERGYNTIPSNVLPATLTDQQATEIHIQENLLRENLPWYDVVTLERDLHDLRQIEHGKGQQGKKTGWSLRDTAEELGRGLGTLSEDLRLADAVLANPKLRKIQDKNTAKRLIISEAKRMEAEIEATLPIKDATASLIDSVYLGDSYEIIKYFPANVFDVCFTDPPWINYKDPTLTKDTQTLNVFKEVYRVLKQGSFLYVICSTQDFQVYQEDLQKIGFQIMQYPLIWVKQNIVSHGLRPWEYMRDYEPILLAVKGSPCLSRSTPPSSSYTSPALHHTKCIHPNEKPVDVVEHFLDHCSYEGSLVIDPFAGSGVVGEACKKMGRHYVLVEKEKKFFDAIKERLK